MDIVEKLHRSLDSRITPEMLCRLILTVLFGRLTEDQKNLLGRAAAVDRVLYTSMSEDFERPVPATHKVRVLDDLMGNLLSDEAKAKLAADPWLLAAHVRAVGLMIGWHPGMDLRTALREYRTSGMSRRRYTRIVRMLIRTEARAERFQQQVLLRQLTLVARSGLAYEITLNEMRADVDAACFVAYWTATKNRRRAFTLAGRANPYDQIAQMLLDRCLERGAATNWGMIARVYPNPLVVARLDDEYKGRLLGKWFGFMTLGAAMLEDLYAAWPDHTVEPAVPDSAWSARPGLMPTREQRGARTGKVVDLNTMIVRQGVDSSTWNTVAGAYNAARDGWMSCLAASGALDLLDIVCPGKAMRLMAADLAAAHRAAGGEPDPQTRVWAALPPPWAVFDGETCTVEQVEAACRAAGVDPHATGWTAPRQHSDTVAEWTPTPELVHGIEVADPLWAGLLRRAGAFSGKPLRPWAEDLLSGKSATAAG